MKGTQHTVIERFTMGNLMYTIAIILALIWGIAFFGYGYSGATHLVLAGAIVLTVIGLTRRTNN
jgi:hypothetical protein